MLSAGVLSGLLHGPLCQVMGGAPDAGFFVLADLTKPHPVLSDLRVRQAIARAIDKQELIDGVLLGLGERIPQGRFVERSAGFVDQVKEALARAMELAKAADARRVIPLQVSGAFHSPLMQKAADKLASGRRRAQVKRSEAVRR